MAQTAVSPKSELVVADGHSIRLWSQGDGWAAFSLGWIFEQVPGEDGASALIATTVNIEQYPERFRLFDLTGLDLVAIGKELRLDAFWNQSTEPERYVLRNRITKCEREEFLSVAANFLSAFRPDQGMGSIGLA